MQYQYLKKSYKEINLAYYIDELQIGSFDPERNLIGLEGYEFGDKKIFNQLTV